MGRTIQINKELEFTCPDPTETSDILFKHKKKKDQKWTLIPEEGLAENPGPHTPVILDIPKMFFDWHEDVKFNQEYTRYNESGVLIDLSVDDTKLLSFFLVRELHRREHGVHFMNFGELEYLTGDHYFFLVYKNMPLAPMNRAQFRKFQRDVFYVIELALKDKNILGAFFAKAKKTGLSEIIASVILNHSTKIRQRSCGVMNKSQDEANDVNINMIWTSYELLPNIFQPSVKSKNLSKIKFGNPSMNFTGTEKNRAKIARLKSAKPLNTWIFSAPTKVEVKFDGPVMYIIHLDEFPKWKVSPKSIFNKVSETVKLQQTIIGKIFITSYPPEEDSKFMAEAKEIYDGSKLSTAKKNPLGRTSTGLICHFVSALVSTDGTFDEYGNSDEQKAFLLNDGERKACKDSKALQAKKRQYPRNEVECWTAGGSGSTFDNEHLSEASQFVEENEQAGNIISVDLNLRWKDGIRFGKVEYDTVTKEETEEGKKGWFNCTEMPDPADTNRCFQDEKGLWSPPYDTKHIGGIDPTEYKNKSGVVANPSDTSMTFKSFFDGARDLRMGRPASNVVILNYSDRREDPDDSLEDVILAIFWLSAFVIIEANKQWMVTKLVNMGLGNFLLLLQADGTIKPYKLGEKNKAITSSTSVINNYCRSIDTWMKKPKQPGEVDYCIHGIKRKKMIGQLMNFNPNDPSPYDDVVSLGYCQLAQDSFAAIIEYLKQNAPDENVMAMAVEYQMGQV